MLWSHVYRQRMGYAGCVDFDGQGRATAYAQDVDDDDMPQSMHDMRSNTSYFAECAFEPTSGHFACLGSDQILSVYTATSMNNRELKPIDELYAKPTLTMNVQYENSNSVFGVRWRPESATQLGIARGGGLFGVRILDLERVSVAAHGDDIVDEEDTVEAETDAQVEERRDSALRSTAAVNWTGSRPAAPRQAQRPRPRRVFGAISSSATTTSATASSSSASFGSSTSTSSSTPSSLRSRFGSSTMTMWSSRARPAPGARARTAADFRVRRTQAEYARAGVQGVYDEFCASQVSSFDFAAANLVLAGACDGKIRLWDVRLRDGRYHPVMRTLSMKGTGRTVVGVSNVEGAGAAVMGVDQSGRVQVWDVRYASRSCLTMEPSRDVRYSARFGGGTIQHVTQHPQRPHQFILSGLRGEESVMAVDLGAKTYAANVVPLCGWEANTDKLRAAMCRSNDVFGGYRSTRRQLMRKQHVRNRNNGVEYWMTRHRLYTQQVLHLAVTEKREALHAEKRRRLKQAAARRKALRKARKQEIDKRVMSEMEETFGVSWEEVMRIGKAAETRDLARSKRLPAQDGKRQTSNKCVPRKDRHKSGGNLASLFLAPNHYADNTNDSDNDNDVEEERDDIEDENSMDDDSIEDSIMDIDEYDDEYDEYDELDDDDDDDRIDSVGLDEDEKAEVLKRASAPRRLRKVSESYKMYLGSSTRAKLEKVSDSVQARADARQRERERLTVSTPRPTATSTSTSTSGRVHYGGARLLSSWTPDGLLLVPCVQCYRNDGGHDGGFSVLDVAANGTFHRMASQCGAKRKKEQDEREADDLPNQYRWALNGVYAHPLDRTVVVGTRQGKKQLLLFGEWFR